MFVPDLSNIQLPPKPVQLSDEKIANYTEQLIKSLKEHNAVLIAHYYTSPEVQQLAEKSGGFIGDSLEMARWGRDHSAQTVIVAGVRFMGETAAILSPEKNILMPDLQAECSLDLGCPAQNFAEFCKDYPDYVKVVYANTSATVKAESDYVVTSSIALELVAYLKLCGKKIIWAPDRHLGTYIQEKTQADMIRWQAHCIVHDEFKANALQALKEQHPDAEVCVHPESPMAVTKMADFAGSTSQILNYVKKSSAKKFIIATDTGIFYKIAQACPDKQLIPAPTGGVGATCQSCAHCPWMRQNTLDKIIATLEDMPAHRIIVDPQIRERSLVPLNRLLDFSASLKQYGSVEAMYQAGVRI